MTTPKYSEVLHPILAGSVLPREMKRKEGKYPSLQNINVSSKHQQTICITQYNRHIRTFLACLLTKKWVRIFFKKSFFLPLFFLFLNSIFSDPMNNSCVKVSSHIVWWTNRYVCTRITSFWQCFFLEIAEEKMRLIHASFSPNIFNSLFSLQKKAELFFKSHVSTKAVNALISNLIKRQKSSKRRTLISLESLTKLFLTQTSC